MLHGILPAIITPFQNTESRELDLDGLRDNINRLLERGIHGVVPCGSTGESATLNFEEHELVISETVDVVNGRVPVIAGTGSNSTDEALRLSRSAKDAGADGVLVISPYYNKPNRPGLIKHYTRLADLEIPVIMYNVPGRTGQNLPPDLVIELAQHPYIAGIKEASGDISQVSAIIEGTRDTDFVVISGDDGMTLPLLALGGDGVISVAANLEPSLMVEMYEQFMSGNLDDARDLHYRLSPLFRAMFIDTNPVPIKTAVRLRGMAAGPLRLPLDDMEDEKVQALREVISTYD
ncbi:MAG: 4-hydroxy-tetrahydrodipicolinate synthase [Methanomicrobiales archaeon]